MIKYALAKTGEYPRIYNPTDTPQFTNPYGKYDKSHRLEFNSRWKCIFVTVRMIYARRYTLIFVLGHDLFLEAHRDPLRRLLASNSILEFNSRWKCIFVTVRMIYARRYTLIFVLGHYLFLEAHRDPLRRLLASWNRYIKSLDKYSCIC